MPGVGVGAGAKGVIVDRIGPGSGQRPGLKRYKAHLEAPARAGDRKAVGGFPGRAYGVLNLGKGWDEAVVAVEDFRMHWLGFERQVAEVRPPGEEVLERHQKVEAEAKTDLDHLSLRQGEKPGEAEIHALGLRTRPVMRVEGLPVAGVEKRRAPVAGPHQLHDQKSTPPSGV